MDDRIKALAAQKRLIETKQTQLAEKAVALEAKLADAFGEAGVYASSASVTLEEWPDGHTYGWLSYAFGRLRVGHRTSDDDMADAHAGNRHGLVVNARVTRADGHAEREAAKIIINGARQALQDAGAEITLGADKGYDAQEFIEACHEMKVTPHVAQNTSRRRSAVADTIASSAGYAISQQKRKLIEQGFGWAKTVGRMRQAMVRGLKKVDQMFVLNMAAYNLVRLRSLAQIRP